MTVYLVYSYCTKLTKNQEIAIDIEVSRNRKKIYIFVRNFLSNAKDKTKKVIIISTLSVGLCFSNLEPSEAIGLSMPPVPIVRG